MKLLTFLGIAKNEGLDLISIGSIALFIKLLTYDSLTHLLVFSVLMMIYAVTQDILRNREKYRETQMNQRISNLENDISAINTAITLRGKHYA